ncbi:MULTISPECIES: hypothetical protein [Staphylococcus]|uniref:Phage protein n=1 Tax=Staphylococcus agnetis TaxID=985762 RepID=A0AAW9YXZ5_9STAP|nr:MULTISPECIES: hypothetical protein [Staphylococcus]NHM92083.1 hypothetical protein [Staphylococcus sp. 10602379]NJI02830.1 hypothetical protein [Staphylococcus agnetis]NJI13451.1 hypothetical protein [Staphylococcus agnetis]QIN23668.1 hypothetical protein GJE18_02510 [Staphylococcus agnetis]
MELESTAIIISIFTAILSLLSLSIVYFNRLDNVRPKILVMYRDQRDDQGRVKREWIEVKNLGKAPAIITKVKVHCVLDILTFNEEIEFINTIERAKSHYLSLENVLNNRCKNKILQPEHSIIIDLRMVALCEYGTVNKLKYLDQFDKYRVNLNSSKHDISIKVEYTSSIVKVLGKNRFSTTNKAIIK